MLRQRLSAPAKENHRVGVSLSLGKVLALWVKSGQAEVEVTWWLFASWELDLLLGLVRDLHTGCWGDTLAMEWTLANLVEEEEKEKMGFQVLDNKEFIDDNWLWSPFEDYVVGGCGQGRPEGWRDAGSWKSAQVTIAKAQH